MDCITIQSELSAFEDGEIHEPDRSIIEVHLKGCADCRGFLRKIRKSWEALDGLPDADPDPFAVKRFLAKIEKRSMKRNAVRWVSAAALLAALGVGSWLGLPSTPPANVPDISAFDSQSTQSDNGFFEIALGDFSPPFDESTLNFTKEDEQP